MPDSLFKALVVILLVIFLASVASWSLTAISYVRRTWGIDVYRRDRVIPHQWLLDVAHVDATQPTQRIVITSRRFSTLSLGPIALPSVMFTVNVYNASIHPLLVTTVRGHATFDGDLLPREVIVEGGVTRIPPRANASIAFVQYVPQELRKAIATDLSGGAMTRFSVNRVQMTCVADVAGAVPGDIPVGGGDGFTPR